MSHGGIPPPFHRSGPPGPFLMQKRERENIACRSVVYPAAMMHHCPFRFRVSPSPLPAKNRAKRGGNSCVCRSVHRSLTPVGKKVTYAASVFVS